MPATRSRPRRRERRTVARGKAFIQSTFNNTLITITDMNGNTLCWASSGSAGFKGSRKGTPYAAQVAAETVARKAADFGMGQVEVSLKGSGIRARVRSSLTPSRRHSGYEHYRCNAYTAQWPTSSQS